MQDPRWAGNQPKGDAEWAPAVRIRESHHYSTTTVTMRLMFACLADHADVNQQGKLNISGIFDRINAAAFPTRQPRMFLVFRLMNDFDDNRKKHSLSIVLRDADHREAAKLQADIETPYVPPGAFASHNQIIQMNDVVFAQPGRYVFALTVDKEPEIEVPFDVAQA